MQTTAAIRQYRRTLQQTALNLSGNKPLPISVGEIVGSLGVTIGRAKDGRATKGHLLTTKTGSEIILPSADGSQTDYSPWERFLIAHELGHFVLERKRVPRPLGESEYWEHEELCDSFARWLLLPTWVSRRLKGDGRRPSQRLNLCQYLKSRARVPWMTAAFRVSDWDPLTRFLLLQGAEDGSLRVVTSTLPNKKAINTQISADHELAVALSSLRSGECAPLELTSVACFQHLMPITSAAASRVEREKIRIALIGSAWE